MKPLILGLTALFAVSLAAGAAIAQYTPPEDRDGGNPVEDFFRQMDRNNPNPRLSCDTYKRLNRQGEIIWLRMECRAIR